MLNLKNRYFIMRHGKSKANEEGIIISNPQEGINNYGLTDLGKDQVQKSSEKNKLLDKNTIIFCSDFKRAKETAEIVKKVIGIKEEINFNKRLRERFFGDWDKTADTNYPKVWQDDPADPDHELNNVESVNNVLNRAKNLIDQIENEYKDRKILFVAHGDVLQILSAYFNKINPGKHRSIPHLDVAKIRELT